MTAIGCSIQRGDPLIIDVRNRPPTPEFQQFFSPEILKFISRRLGVPYPRHFASGSVEDWAAEIRDSEVDRVVIIGRNTRACVIPNEHVSSLQEKYDDFAIGIGGIDIVGALHDPIKEMLRCVDVLGLHGVAVDPGTAFGSSARNAGYPIDHRDFMSFYQACEERQAPVFMMTGPFAGADCSYGNPVALDRISGLFPRLRIVAGHGCYPFATPATCVAFKHPRVYLAPDCYMFAPGAGPYVEAIRGPLGRQMLFGSAYPFSNSIAEVLMRTRTLDVPEPALTGYLGENAQVLFPRIFSR